MELIKTFAIIHQYDERLIYKEQWTFWYNEHKEEFEREIERMNNIGYVGDVKDKMFKAGRYYFRKKNIKNINNITNNPIVKVERKYITMMNETLYAMDKHIKQALSTNDQFKPSEGYIQFCEENESVIRTEIHQMIKDNIIDKNDIPEKIKKTYKNRYYMMMRK
jgi:hypothetical protein